jgi:hypothetical protein
MAYFSMFYERTWGDNQSHQGTTPYYFGKISKGKGKQAVWEGHHVRS